MTERRETNPAGAPIRRRHPLLRWAPLALLVTASAAVLALGGHKYLALEAILAYRDTLQAFVEAKRALAMLAAALVYVGVVALSLPGSAMMTILCGFLFGWLAGGALAVAAATLGAIVLYGVARTSIGDALVQMAGPRLQALAGGFRRDAFSYLLFLRFLPVVPFWLTNLASALFGVPLRTFALGTLLGIVPASFTLATAGAGLDGVIEIQREAQAACRAAGGADCPLDLSLRSLFTPTIIAAFVGLGLLSLVPVILRRRARRRGEALDGTPGAA